MASRGRSLAPGEIETMLLEDGGDGLSDPEIDDEDGGAEEHQGDVIELIFNAEGELVAQIPRYSTCT